MFLPIAEAVSFVPAAVAIIMICTAGAVMSVVIAGGRYILEAIEAERASSGDDDPFADYDWTRHEEDERLEDEQLRREGWDGRS